MGWLNRLVIHVMNAPRPSPLFTGLSLQCIIVKANGNGEGLGMRLPLRAGNALCGQVCASKLLIVFIAHIQII